MSYSKGDRVELVHLGDPYSKLQPGDLGTVTMIDSTGTIHINWDAGSNLGIIEEAGDRIKRSPDDLVSV